VGDNGRSFLPVWDTLQKNFRMFGEFSSVASQKAEGFFRHIRNQNSFSSVVSHTVKIIFFGVSCNAEGIFCCGIQQRKIKLHRIKFLNFKCFLLTSDETLGKAAT
jgi:hypothetical protein